MCYTAIVQKTYKLQLKMLHLRVVYLEIKSLTTKFSSQYSMLFK